eukprot:3886388-Rhodomonas_salina.1
MCKLQLVGLFHWAHHIVPEFLMPANMASHWGIFGCGGVHDSKKQCCHCCNMKTADRFKIFEYSTLPRHPTNPDGKWRPGQAEEELGMHLDDMVKINTQIKETEASFLQFHIDVPD